MQREAFLQTLANEPSRLSTPCRLVQYYRMLTIDEMADKLERNSGALEALLGETLLDTTAQLSVGTNPMLNVSFRPMFVFVEWNAEGIDCRIAVRRQPANHWADLLAKASTLRLERQRDASRAPATTAVSAR